MWTFLLAQCNQFENFDFLCAKEQLKNLKTIEIVIKDLEKSKYLLTQNIDGYLSLYFFKEIQSSKRECSVFFTEKSFNNKYTRTSLKISLNSGLWSEDNTESITLKRRDGKCYLEAKRGYPVNLEYKEKNENEWLFYLSLLLLGLSIFLVSRTLFQEEEQIQAGQTIEEQTQDSSSSLIKIKPFLKKYIVPLISSRKKKLEDDYKRKLAMAGLLRQLSPEEFFSLKIFLIFIFPMMFILLRIGLDASWPFTYSFVIALIGYFYPNIWINSLIEKRREELTLQMPFIVDMLALSMEAGLDFTAAMARIIEKAKPGPLVQEFSIFLKEIQVGSSRSEALRQLSWRVNTISVASFTSTLIAADSVGASIGGILKELSKELRQRRSTIAEKKGSQASTKMMFPMMMFILPAIFLIIAAPFMIGLFVK